MKKVILFTVFICALFALPTGCSVKPDSIQWVLNYYISDGGCIEPSFNRIHHFDTLECADILLSFSEDKTFSFRAADGTFYGGIYTCEDSKRDTSVTLYFENGETASGTCTKYYFDGVWYEACFSIFGVDYYFDGCDQESEYEWRTKSSYLDDGLKEIAELLETLDGSGEDLPAHSFYRGTVEQINGFYFLRTADAVYCLDTAIDCGFYEYDSDYALSETSLKIGSCYVYRESITVTVPLQFGSRETELYSFALYFPQ